MSAFAYVLVLTDPDKVTLGVRQESLPFDRTLCCGYMMKQGGKGVFKNWKKRWFDLKADHCLYYYKTDQVGSCPLIITIRLTSPPIRPIYLCLLWQQDYFCSAGGKIVKINIYTEIVSIQSMECF